MSKSNNMESVIEFLLHQFCTTYLDIEVDESFIKEFAQKEGYLIKRYLLETHGDTQPETARKLLKIRDALVNNDINEAYHYLYQIASPSYDKMADEVWKSLEEKAEEDK